MKENLTFEQKETFAFINFQSTLGQFILLARSEDITEKQKQAINTLVCNVEAAIEVYLKATEE